MMTLDEALHYIHAVCWKGSIPGLERITALLEAMGVHCESDAHEMHVTGVTQLHGGCTVSSAGDHRIAMAAAIAALNCDAPITLTGAEAVRKSYPHFFQDYSSLGGVCDGI